VCKTPNASQENIAQQIEQIMELENLEEV